MNNLDYKALIILALLIMVSVGIETNIITEEELEDNDKVAYTEYCTEDCETYHSNECEKANTQF